MLLYELDFPIQKGLIFRIVKSEDIFPVIIQPGQYGKVFVVCKPEV